MKRSLPAVALNQMSRPTHSDAFKPSRAQAQACRQRGVDVAVDHVRVLARDEFRLAP